MLKDLAAAIWRRLPRKLKNWSVRSAQPRFTVTAAAIVTNAEGRVLLLNHRFRAGSGWGIPGGFIEYGEQPQLAVQRELREEVGLEMKDLRLLTARAFKNVNQIEIVYTARAASGADELSFEIKGAGWFDVNELPNGLPADQVRLVKLALADRGKRGE
ncbi:MAG TPA: NUDIX domain-containing protein [Pyrinomonadaceae bacterium]|nr:NUDIX domain-containing protein [Pyrinomonadaceae bacterium]